MNMSYKKRPDMTQPQQPQKQQADDLDVEDLGVQKKQNTGIQITGIGKISEGKVSDYQKQQNESFNDYRNNSEVQKQGNKFQNPSLSQSNNQILEKSGSQYPQIYTQSVILSTSQNKQNQNQQSVVKKNLVGDRLKEKISSLKGTMIIPMKDRFIEENIKQDCNNLIYNASKEGVFQKVTILQTTIQKQNKQQIPKTLQELVQSMFDPTNFTQPNTIGETFKINLLCTREKSQSTQERQELSQKVISMLSKNPQYNNLFASNSAADQYIIDFETNLSKKLPIFLELDQEQYDTLIKKNQDNTQQQYILDLLNDSITTDNIKVFMEKQNFLRVKIDDRNIILKPFSFPELLVKDYPDQTKIEMTIIITPIQSVSINQQFQQKIEQRLLKGQDQYIYLDEKEQIQPLQTNLGNPREKQYNLASIYQNVIKGLWNSYNHPIVKSLIYNTCYDDIMLERELIQIQYPSDQLCVYNLLLQQIMKGEQLTFWMNKITELKDQIKGKIPSKLETYNFLRVVKQDVNLLAQNLFGIIEQILTTEYASETQKYQYVHVNEFINRPTSNDFHQNVIIYELSTNQLDLLFKYKGENVFTFIYYGEGDLKAKGSQQKMSYLKMNYFQSNWNRIPEIQPLRKALWQFLQAESRTVKKELIFVMMTTILIMKKLSQLKIESTELIVLQ